MLESMGRIAGYTAGLGREEFLSDRKTIDAVVRNLEVVGEAASRLTDAARGRRGDIEWPLIVGLRNRIVHEYFGIDTEIVWEIISHDLSALGNCQGSCRLTLSETTENLRPFLKGVSGYLLTPDRSL
jgi:uncharacterized protein with HEPN domain